MISSRCPANWLSFSATISSAGRSATALESGRGVRKAGSRPEWVTVIGALAEKVGGWVAGAEVWPDRMTTMIASSRQTIRAILAIRTIGRLESGGGGEVGFIVATRCS